jgi:DNA-binding CsgD family transcriptional regulator
MKQSAQVAYVRQICASALPAEAVAALLANALPSLVPSAFMFCWTNDCAGNVVAVVGNDSSALAHFSATYPGMQSASTDPSTDPSTESSYKVRLSSGRSAVDNSSNMGHACLASELYERVFRPLGVDSGIRGIAISPRGNSAGIGMLRLRGERKMGEVHERQLAAVLPYIEYALDVCPPEAGVATIYDGKASMMVNARTGERFENAEANRLILLAAGNCVDAENMKRQWVRQLVQNLLTLDAGAGTYTRAELPHFTVQNAFGIFSFRAQWLVSSLRPDRRMVSIDIERQMPRLMRALERIPKLPLSPRQREICVRLADGRSIEEVANALGLRPATMTGYVTDIYERLGVHSRAELIERVLA